MLSVDSAIPELKADLLFTIFGFPVTNSMMGGILVTIYVLIICLVAANQFKLRPGKFQLVMESIYSFLRTFVNQITGDEAITKQFFAIVAALFIYVLLSNIGTLFPVIPGFTYEGKSLFRTHTFDLNTTYALAFGVVLLTQFTSAQKFGFWNHIFKFIKIPAVVNGFKQGIGPGLMSIVDLFLGIMDIIGEIAKTISLSLRLLGNMFSGELLMALVLSVIAVGLPLPVIFLSLFSGTVQAIIFMALTTAYLSLSIKD